MLYLKNLKCYPNIWPSYFEKSQGCKVWDLDGNRFNYVCVGIGTNILGYGNKEVDKSVEQVLKKGNMSSLNCPEEVLLARKQRILILGLIWLSLPDLEERLML